MLPWLTTIVFLILVFFDWQASVYSMSLYLHRTMTHRSTGLHAFVAFLMRFHLWRAAGQTMKGWVAVHKKHHHKADTPEDPHSPKYKGVWNVVFFNSLLYIKEAMNTATIEEYARGIPKSKLDFLLESTFIGLFVGISLYTIIFSLLVGFWPGILIVLAAYLAHFILYVISGGLVNGICHTYGYRNFQDNEATNVRWVGWLLAGEGLHNNHHHDITSPKLSYTKEEFDPGWMVIRLLTCLGLANPLPTINEKETHEPANK